MRIEKAQMKWMKIGKSGRRSGILVLGLLLAISMVSLQASAGEYHLYATVVEDSASCWARENGAEGQNNCGGNSCDCAVGSEVARNETNNCRLWAYDFDHFSMPPYQYISGVKVDVSCRYANGSSGQVKMSVKLPSLGDFWYQGLDSPVFVSGSTDCRWRMSGHGYVTGIISGWTESLINDMQVSVRRMGDNGTILRVRAIRVTVTTTCVSDDDGDGTCNEEDGCPQDPNKTVAGLCGCNHAELDTDGDGTCDWEDECPTDPNKIVAGLCGCHHAELDTDGDGTCDWEDECPNDPNKIHPGDCDCGEADTDANGNGISDCLEPDCPSDCLPGWIGDGWCDEECFTEGCNWDGGDCEPLCTQGCPEIWIGDGICDEGCNNSGCDWDGGDCILCAPDCPNYWVGDGECDEECNTAECDWDGGDCEPECAPGCPGVWIGDDFCDEECNNADCLWDGGDCAEYNACAPSGLNSLGQLGLGDNSNRISFAEFPEMTGVVGLAAGQDHTLVVKNDGTVWSTGANSSGQLGLGDITDQNDFTEVTDIQNAIAVACGKWHSLALTDNGTVWSSGYNGHGELGLGEGSDWQYSSFTQVAGLSDVIALAAGEHHTLALKNDGTLWVTGDNTYGQLGLGTAGDVRSSFTQVPGVTDIMAIAAGAFHSFALESDGTLLAAGWNMNGQLGLGDTLDRSQFISVPVSDVKAVVAGGYHSLIVLNDESMQATGANNYGQLGLGDTAGRDTFIDVPGLTDGREVSAGSFHSLALQEDGTLWSAGHNGYGQLGHNDLSHRNEFTQVETLERAFALAAGGYHSMAIAIEPVPTVGAELTSEPSEGTLPFATSMTVTLTNNETEEHRMVAGRLDVILANGTVYPNWRSGHSTLQPGESHVSSWSQYIPMMNSVIGANTFNLSIEDVTPAPYNQPPYQPSGDTDQDSCVVEGIAP